MTGRISGRVVTADTGRPIKRARVTLTAPELPGGRGTLTDGEGVFDLPELPVGRYMLFVGKNGFVTLSYGQRRPLEAGTPLQLEAGQHLRGIEFRLPRGSVIAGHVFDESGDPSPGIAVRVWRYQYAQGVRQLVPVGMALTDDRGEYRVWGLNPGVYYVSAVPRDANVPRSGGRPPDGGGRGAVGGQPVGGGTATLSPDDDRQEESGYAPTYYPGVDSVELARPVSVALAVEVPSIDFSLLLVRTSTITGRVAGPDGRPVQRGLVTLSLEGAGGRSASGMRLGARLVDGAFTIAQVPPGR